MTMQINIPQDQTIRVGADGFAVVYVVCGDHAQYYRCYPADFSNATKNKPCVKSWYDAGNPMPEVAPYAPPVVSLGAAKLAKEAAINAKTDEILSHGVPVVWEEIEYLIDTRGGSRAADNWSEFRDAVAFVAAGLIPEGNLFPRTVYTKDRRPIVIETAATGAMFSLLCSQATRAVLAAGGVLLEQLDACETVAEVDALEDDR